MSANAFPSVIDAMAKECIRSIRWVEIIPFDTLLNRGLEAAARRRGSRFWSTWDPGADLSISAL